jgi:hypothetical protein
MNDPRILNDPEIMEDTELIREVHAIRLKLQDEIKGMTPDQVKEYWHIEREKIDADCARLGFKLNYVDLSGQGRIVQPVMAGN